MACSVGEELLHCAAAVAFGGWHSDIQRAVILLNQQFLNDFRPCITKVQSNNAKGLHLLPSLTSLQLHLDSKQGLQALATLGKLRMLEVLVVIKQHDDQPDLAPVSTLVSLESLRVGVLLSMETWHRHRLVALEPLTALTSLLDLSVVGFFVADLRPIAGLTRLTALELQPIVRVATADLSLLSSLDQLRALTLHGTDHVPTSSLDLGPLTSMTGLTSLHMYFMPGVSLDPIGQLQLRELTFSGITEHQTYCGYRNKSETVNLEPVGACLSLESLGLSGSNVCDLAPLAALSQLRKLDISGTAVTDLSPLAACTVLVHLNVCETSVTDFEPLAGLGDLIVHYDGFVASDDAGAS